MDHRKNHPASDYQDLHMCKLLQQGLMEERDRRSNRPGFICNKCGAKANESRDVCQPRPIRPLP